MRSQPFVLLVLSACITPPRAYPLYAGAAREQPAGEVGTLRGPIAAIDGQDVSDKGRAFALLPGCHSFRLLQKIGQFSLPGGGYAATLPQQTFTIDVRAGHSYVIETIVTLASGPTGTLELETSDRRPDGTVTHAQTCAGP